jgi:hypothetical protein
MFRGLLYSASLSLAVFCASAFGDEFPRMDAAISRYNEQQIRNYHPVFDFDFDGCYPATPFNRNDNLSQNPGLDAGGRTIEGQCRDNGWIQFANTIHRQLCNERDEAQGRVRRCAHFYELYFEKDQAVHWSFLGGHRHDVETVIVWTGRIDYWSGGSSEFASHIAVSAHGRFTTRHLTETIHHLGHAHVVYHKDGASTHAFRFANQSDRARVEFLGNWGEFYAPDIISHYRAYQSWSDDEWDRYWQNSQYRTRLQDSNFGSASFKSRNDGEILWQANNNVPTWDSFWTGFSFTWDDVWFTRDQELQANYPAIRHLLPE